MNNQEIRKAWNALDGEAMYSKIERACREVIRQRPNMARAACVCAAELAGEAWIRIDSKLCKGAESESIDKLVIVAATEALTAAARFNAHSAGGSIDAAGAGETVQADSLTEKLEAREELTSGVKRPVETAIINRLSIDAAAADKRDTAILAALKQGLSNNELATMLGISAAAVTQRKKKIGERISAALDDDISAAELDKANASEQQRRDKAGAELEHYKAAQMRNKN